VVGYLDLRQAISEKFKRENGLDYPADQIVVSTGAKQSIINVLLSLLNAGDEVIIPTPFWVSYSEMVKLSEGVPVYVHSNVTQDYKPTVSQIEASITPKTKAFIFHRLVILQVLFLLKTNFIALLKCLKIPKYLHHF